MDKDIDGLDWLRVIRKKIAADCHYDPKIMGDYYRRIQKQYEHRIVRNPYEGSDKTLFKKDK